MRTWENVTARWMGGSAVRLARVLKRETTARRNKREADWREQSGNEKLGEVATVILSGGSRRQDKKAKAKVRQGKRKAERWEIVYSVAMVGVANFALVCRVGVSTVMPQLGRDGGPPRDRLQYYHRETPAAWVTLRYSQTIQQQPSLEGLPTIDPAPRPTPSGPLSRGRPQPQWPPFFLPSWGLHCFFSYCTVHGELGDSKFFWLRENLLGVQNSSGDWRWGLPWRGGSRSSSQTAIVMHGEFCVCFWRLQNARS